MEYKNKVYNLDFCEECFQMTNHLNGKCQKCVAKSKEAPKSYDDEDEYENERIR